jgi:hypothetical protein
MFFLAVAVVRMVDRIVCVCVCVCVCVRDMNLERFDLEILREFFLSHLSGMKEIDMMNEVLSQT